MSNVSATRAAGNHGTAPSNDATRRNSQSDPPVSARYGATIHQFYYIKRSED
jgi:hypothetical protein